MGRLAPRVAIYVAHGLAALLLVSWTADARACGGCNDPRTWEEVAVEPHVFFAGRFVGEARYRYLEKLPWLLLPHSWGIGEEGWTHNFEVEQWWNRPVSSRVSVAMSIGCGYGPPDTRDLVFVEASVEGDRIPYADLCLRFSRIYTEARKQAIVDSMQRHDPVYWETWGEQDERRMMTGQVLAEHFGPGEAPVSFLMDVHRPYFGLFWIGFGTLTIMLGGLTIALSRRSRP